MGARDARGDTAGMTLPLPTGELLRRYARDRRDGDLADLVDRFQPLARSLTRRYRMTGVAHDDLDQAASLGLVRALQGFDPARGHAFSTYAVPTILGEIRRQCRDVSWSAHVPRLMRRRAREVRAAAARLGAELGRGPTVEELAARVGADGEAIVAALTAAAARHGVPLDRPAGEDGATLIETLGDADPGFELAECHVDVERAIPRLGDDEQLVLRLRFAEERTFAEIGRELSVGPGQAARIAHRAVERLRSFTADGAVAA